MRYRYGSRMDDDSIPIDLFELSTPTSSVNIDCRLSSTFMAIPLVDDTSHRMGLVGVTVHLSHLASSMAWRSALLSFILLFIALALWSLRQETFFRLTWGHCIRLVLELEMGRTGSYGLTCNNKRRWCIRFQLSVVLFFFG